MESLAAAGRTGTRANCVVEGSVFLFLGNEGFVEDVSRMCWSERSSRCPRGGRSNQLGRSVC